MYVLLIYNICLVWIYIENLIKYQYLYILLDLITNVIVLIVYYLYAINNMYHI